MKNYSSYEFYISQYGGEALTEFQFDKAAIKASAYLDKVTFGRVSDYTETSENELQYCVCEMAEAIHEHDVSLVHGRVVQSASNQGYSESYAVPAINSAVGILTFNLMDIAKLYLPAELLELSIDEV